ncbi:hypothetical protein [Nocardia sp. NPDC050406]|uniref:hypothetical protein n=1 Tax=Nocardia sp. NPDC050406 TaxID=3364318 RepID=UPI0037952CBD
MHNMVIAALGAVGAWLLVAGPLHQATIELREQGLTDRANLPDPRLRPRRISPWWWLLPPVAYWKHHRERDRIKRLALETMSASDIERMLAFSNTALGWLFVAAGATLIAIKETYELVEIGHWHPAWTWIIVATALLFAVGNAALQTSRTSRILAASGGAG